MKPKTRLLIFLRLEELNHIYVKLQGRWFRLALSFKLCFVSWKYGKVEEKKREKKKEKKKGGWKIAFLFSRNEIWRDVKGDVC